MKEKKSKKELNESQLNLSKRASLDLFDRVGTRGSEIVIVHKYKQMEIKQSMSLTC